MEHFVIKKLAAKLIGFDMDNFIGESNKQIEESQIAHLFYRMDKW